MSKTRRLEHQARRLRDSAGPDIVVFADKRPGVHRKARFSRAHEALVRRIVEQAYTDPQVFTIREAYRRYCCELLASERPDELPMTFTAFRYWFRTRVGSQPVKQGARPPFVPGSVNVRKRK